MSAVCCEAFHAPDISRTQQSALTQCRMQHMSYAAHVVCSTQLLPSVKAKDGLAEPRASHVNNTINGSQTADAAAHNHGTISDINGKH